MEQKIAKALNILFIPFPLTQAIIVAKAIKQCCDGKQLTGFVEPQVHTTSLSVKVTGVKSGLVNNVCPTKYIIPDNANDRIKVM